MRTANSAMTLPKLAARMRRQVARGAARRTPAGKNPN